MSDIQLFQFVTVLYLMFAIRMRVWQTSINTFVVFCAAFVIMIGYSSDDFKFIFEHRIWIFSGVLTFLFARVAYQQISRKYYDNFGVKLRRATDRLDVVEEYCHETGCPMLHKKIEEKKNEKERDAEL